MISASFSPMLYIPSGTFNIGFYSKVLDADIVRTFNNDDGSIHVAEFSIGGTLFHLHEEKTPAGHLTPQMCKGTTCAIGLWVDDVDQVLSHAVAAGAELLSPAVDFEYGYRQGSFKDPFGHEWVIQKVIA